MTKLTYEEVWALVQQLALEEQLRLMEDLIRIIRSQVIDQLKHSNTETEEQSKEISGNVDAETQIDYEQASDQQTHP